MFQKEDNGIHNRVKVSGLLSWRVWWETSSPSSTSRVDCPPTRYSTATWRARTMARCTSARKACRLTAASAAVRSPRRCSPAGAPPSADILMHAVAVETMRFLGCIARKGLTLFNHMLMRKFGQNPVSDTLCRFGFEPVNLVTGVMDFAWDDFELGGDHPLSMRCRWFSNMAYSGVMGNGVACAMQYDGVGRPSRQSVTHGGHSLYNRSYRWDDDFRLSHAHDAISGRGARYLYDDFGSLAEAEYGDGARQWRNPDVMGNVYDSADRTDRTYARGGQLREDRRWRYHYDKQGNLVLKTKRKISPIAETPQGNRKSVFGLFSGSNTSKEGREQEELIAWHPGDYAYTWLPNGMLDSVTRPDGKTVTFKYDALGRRIEKSFNGRVHRYLWDGDVVLHEWEYDETERPQQIVAENGEVSSDRPEPTDNLVTWIYDTDSYVPTAKLVNGKRYGIVSDYVGRPVQAYDEHGTLVWQADYDIYGNLLNLKGNREFVPFRQLGQYEDEETGLYYNRFRYYDPSTGGYISQDPIGLAGNNPTLYGYVSDTNSWVDTAWTT